MLMIAYLMLMTGELIECVMPQVMPHDPEHYLLCWFERGKPVRTNQVLLWGHETQGGDDKELVQVPGVRI